MNNITLESKLVRIRNKTSKNKKQKLGLLTMDIKAKILSKIFIIESSRLNLSLKYKVVYYSKIN